jgi:hypothetical protein
MISPSEPSLSSSGHVRRHPTSIGPHPASTNFGATCVGTFSIRRFLRLVAHQNLPAALLPEDLRT